MDFREIIEKLQDIHFYDVVLPFLLVYVIVYAILQKTKIFKVEGEGASNKHLNAAHVIISVVFGLFAVVSLQTVMYMQNLILNISLFLIFILVVLIMLGMVFGEDYKKLFIENGKIKSWAAWVVGILIFIVALGVLLSVTGLWDQFVDWYDRTNFDWDGWSTLFVIAVIGIIIFLVSREGGSSKGESKKEDSSK
jgi:hypothetical protein